MHFTGLQSGDLLWGGHWPWEARQQVTKPAFDRLETSDTLISKNENSNSDNQIARPGCSGSLCGRCTRRRRIGRRAQNRISKQGIFTPNFSFSRRKIHALDHLLRIGQVGKVSAQVEISVQLIFQN